MSKHMSKHLAKHMSKEGSANGSVSPMFHDASTVKGKLPHLLGRVGLAATGWSTMADLRLLASL